MATQGVIYEKECPKCAERFYLNHNHAEDSYFYSCKNKHTEFYCDGWKCRESEGEGKV